MSLLELFREHRRTILPALLFCLANVVLFSAYRLLYAGRVELLTSRLERREAELVTVEARLAELVAKHQEAAQRERDLATLYDQRFATEAERLTAFLSEIKRLADEAGLDPPGFSYPTQLVKDFGLLERATVFSVEGSYEALRKLINLIEVSDSFLMLQQVSVTDREGEDRGAAPLAISLRIATLFADPSADPRRRGGAAGPEAVPGAPDEATEATEPTTPEPAAAGDRREAAGDL